MPRYTEWDEPAGGGKTGHEDAPVPRGQPISRACLYRWIRVFEAQGYEGLLPRVRKDCGKARTGKAGSVAYAIGLLYEQPERSLYQLETWGLRKNDLASSHLIFGPSSTPPQSRNPHRSYGYASGFAPSSGPNLTPI